MTDQAKPEDQALNELVGFIQTELQRKPEPGQDLGITLPKPGPDSRHLYVGGNMVEIINDTPRYRPVPKPPYRCVCGETFPDVETLLAHRHPNQYIWDYDTQERIPALTITDQENIAVHKQRMPRPPYWCRCGAKFDTPEGILAHRHTTPSYWDTPEGKLHLLKTAEGRWSANRGK